MRFNPLNNANILYNYSPRDLIVTEKSLSNNFSNKDLLVDAIYIPSYNRPKYVSEILNVLANYEIPIFIMPSSEFDLPLKLKKHFNVSCIMIEEDIISLMKSLKSADNSIFTTSFHKWDLPAKRNQAIIHSKRLGFDKILLLDDDIRGLTKHIITSGANALNEYHIVGLFVNNFPDTSVIGHIELELGLDIETFISGSCLFLNLDNADLFGPFIPMYNEDWLSMIPSILKNKVASIGVIEQKAYNPYQDVNLAAWQEPGEIIVEGLYTLIASNSYEYRFYNKFWDDFLLVHRESLKALLHNSNFDIHKNIISKALHVSNIVNSDNCLEFISHFENDRITWKSKIRDLP